MSNENAIPNSRCSLLQVCYMITDCKNFFYKELEDISPFCGATDTPVFGLLVMSPLDFKARVYSLVCMLYHLCTADSSD